MARFVGGVGMDRGYRGAALERIASALEQLVARANPVLFGASAPGEITTEHALIERWRSHRIAVDGVSAEHAASCAECVGRFLVECGSPLRAVTPAVVASWVQGRACSRKRVANVLSMLRFFGDFLVIIGERADNPWRAFRMSRVRKERGYDAFTAEQAAALFASVARQSREADGRSSVHGDRRLAFYRFLWLTGLRWREARLQEWADVDLDRARMVVTHDKAGRRDAIPLSAEVVTLLREWRGVLDARGTGAEAASRRVFHRPVGRKRMVADLKAAGLPRGRGLFHRWRVGFVTRLLDGGAELADVSHLARHATLNQTLDYDRASESRLRRSLEKSSAAQGHAVPSVAAAEFRNMESSPRKCLDGKIPRADITRRHTCSQRPFEMSIEKRRPDPLAVGQKCDNFDRDGASPCSVDGADAERFPKGNGPEGSRNDGPKNAIDTLAESVRLLVSLLAERSASDGGRTNRRRDDWRGSDPARVDRTGRYRAS